ncbi:MAG: Veg family protein [Synergistetes bacterium]|nr:MAG: Uncharacterized protein XD52_0589 [bacterium 42_11]MBC7332223.1 Veg family protein [Synergistota bacterium]MDK2871940.1 hypothetical protein [bacterium]
MKNSLSEIRKKIEAHLGEKVRVRANKGRKKIEEKYGVLEETYPCLFTVKIVEAGHKVSYSYAELLTREVEVELCSTRQKIL